MARLPHVVILVENLPVPLDRRVWKEATALRAAGWQVTVIGPRGRAPMRALREVVEGITVLRYPLRPASRAASYALEYPTAMLFTWTWLLWVRLHGRIDVLHGCNPPDLFWIFGLLIKASGGAYVYDQHEPVPELLAAKFPQSPVMRILDRILRRQERYSYRTADAVFTVNESMRHLVLERSDLPPELVTVLWNAPDVSNHRALAAGVLPHGRRVGYVGVMNTQEGLDLLLDAWQLVVAEPGLGDAHLDLVGDGEARPDLERRAANLGIGHSVTFRGFLPPSAYVPILAACRIGVSPDPPSSFNHLATMVKVLDYMAIGRGTVSFDLTETVRVAGPSAKIARPATARALAGELIAVLRDSSESDALGAAAATRIDELNLDWAVSAQRLVRCYEEIAARLGTTGRRPIPR